MLVGLVDLSELNVEIARLFVHSSHQGGRINVQVLLTHGLLAEVALLASR